jgi:hypothetical protein
VIDQPQPKELDRVVGRNRQAQLAGDAVALLRKRAIAEAVLHAHMPTAGRLRRRRPHPAVGLVAQVQHIADRVVRPGREPVFAAILRPGVAAAALGDDEAEALVSDDIAPGRRRGLAGRQVDHELAAGIEAAIRCGQVQRGRRQREATGAIGAAWRQQLHQRVGGAPAQMLAQAAAAGREQRPRDGLDQHAIFLGQHVGAQHEDAAALIEPGARTAAAHQAEDLVLHALEVAAGVLVHNHQIDAQALEPPVLMGLEQLLHQRQIIAGVDLHHNDREIARDAIGPQARLALEVALEHLGPGALQAIHIQRGGRQALEALRSVGADIEVAQLSLALGPGHGKCTRRRVGVAVFARQLDGLVAAGGHAGGEDDQRRAARHDPHAAAQAEDRIEHRAGMLCQRPMQRQRVGGCAAAPNKRRAVGLVLGGAGGVPAHGDGVQRP